MKLEHLKFIIISLTIFSSVSILLVYGITTYHNEKLFERINNFYSKLDHKLHNVIVFAINKDKKVVIQFDNRIEDSQQMMDYVQRGFRSPRDIELPFMLPYEFKKTVTSCCFICNMIKRNLFLCLYEFEQYLVNKEFSDHALFIYIELDHLLVHFTSQKEDQTIKLIIPVYQGSMMTRKLLLWYFRKSIYP